MKIIRRPLLLLSLLIGLSPLQQLLAESAPPPNIVFIIADDLGWADVGFHGGNAPTPNLDKLAKEGLELTGHYVAPVCSPTRAGFLTGRCWSRFGITTPTNSRALPPETVTLATALGSRGYEACLIGKWHLGSTPESGPNHYGFDHSYGSLAGGITAWSHFYKKGPFSVTWHRNEKPIEEEGHVTDLLTNEAVNWIGARGDKPFFLYVPFTAVHLPVNEPEEWLARVPASITSKVGRHYAACIMHLDDGVGRILKALDEKGVRENTIVVFTSDNGGSTATNNTQPYPPDDSPSGPLPGNNAPLRGQKGSVYEGGTRAATLISWPGRIEAGEDSTPTFIADWMPTFCHLAGYEPARDLKWDGTDLSGLLLEKTPIPERPIYIAGPGWKARSLRQGGWKLVVSGEGDNQSLELFHVTEDQSEKKNLADSEPERVSAMLALLKEQSQSDNDSVVK